MRVTTPESAQTTSSRPGVPTSLRISAETMKMPEPIIEPTTSAVASRREMAFTNSVCGCCAVAMRVLGREEGAGPHNLVGLKRRRYLFAGPIPLPARDAVRLLPREEEF